AGDRERGRGRVPAGAWPGDRGVGQLRAGDVSDDPARERAAGLRFQPNLAPAATGAQYGDAVAAQRLGHQPAVEVEARRDGEAMTPRAQVRFGAHRDPVDAPW